MTRIIPSCNIVNPVNEVSLETSFLPFTVSFCAPVIMSGLSSRGHLNLTQVIAKIPKSILEPTSNPNVVDLSMAENHLIREEILCIVKSSIAKNLHLEVRHIERCHQSTI